MNSKNPKKKTVPRKSLCSKKQVCSREKKSYVVELPAVFDLKNKWTIADLEKLRKLETSDIMRKVLTWRITALIAMDRADSLVQKTGISTRDDLIAFIRATSIASVLATCSNELEGIFKTFGENHG